VDSQTFQGWQTVNWHKGGSLLLQHSRLAEASDPKGVDARAYFATGPTGSCTLLGDDLLCKVQSRLGPDLLPLVCHTYPRQRVPDGAGVSMYLGLGCPRAAELALASPEAMDMVVFDPPAESRLPPVIDRQQPGLATAAALEDASIDALAATSGLLADSVRRLIRTPTLTVWQAWALFRLSATELVVMINAAADKAALVGHVLALHRMVKQAEELPAAARAAEALVAQVEPLPQRLQMASHALSRLAAVRRPTPAVTAIAQSLAAFEVREDSSEAAVKRACELYEQAAHRWFEPFNEAHPHLLKNFLLNRLGIRAFPAAPMAGFGRELATESYYLGLLRVLLVARAHDRQEAFGMADYVEVVQASTRYLMNVD
jgi:hypothetical protein